MILFSLWQSNSIIKIPINITGLALGIAIVSYSAMRREKRSDLFLSLWKEYGSREMLDALMALYKLWNDKGGNDSKIVKEYIKRFHDEADKNLHYQCRKVSLLYQMIAFSYFNNLFTKEFKKKWLDFNLGFIAVLKPIETEAIPQILKGQSEFPETLTITEDIKSKDFRRMFDLYNKIKKQEKPPSDFEK